jgi:hypothetical protein
VSPPDGELPVRASDVEREHVARSLGAHLAAGRLTFEEFSARVDRAYRATTLAELAALRVDLPAAPAAPTAPAEPARLEREPRRPFWPGNLPFATHIETRVNPQRIRQEALRTVVPRLIAEGYRLETDKPTLLVLSKTYRPGWTIALAVFIFPIGLLALLHQDRSQVMISLDARDRETTIEVAGTAPLAVRRAVRNLGRDDG